MIIIGCKLKLLVFISLSLISRPLDIPNDNDYETTRTKISFNTLIYNLLPCLPKLMNLKINVIDFNEENYSQVTSSIKFTSN